MHKNLAQLEQAEMDKVNVDLAAAGVAFLRDWFRERLIAHRLASVSLSRLPYEPKPK